MRYLNGNYYVEVKDKRYFNNPKENIVLRRQEGPKSLRTQYEVHNETQNMKNQVIRNQNYELLVEIYPPKSKTSCWKTNNRYTQLSNL